MNKKVMLGITASALLAVLPVQADADCTHQSVKLIIKKNELKLVPTAPKCVDLEDGFKISITPPGAAEEGYVTVEEKDDVPSEIEIRGNNSPDPDTVAVTVTGDPDPNRDYGYIVRVRGHGELDPEVRVVSSRMLYLKSRLAEVDAVLEDEMGFSLKELNENQEELNVLSEDAK